MKEKERKKLAECIAVERKTRLQAIPFQYVESRFGRTRESELAEKGGGGLGQTNLQVDQPKPPSLTRGPRRNPLTRPCS